MIDIAAIDFTKLNGLVPCVVQDPVTRTVLMVGFMNAEAVTKTLESKKVTFFSRSKNRLWMKGETSGHVLNLVDIRLDCDADSLLVYAYPNGPVCHTGEDTCFKEKNEDWNLNSLEKIINDRKNNPGKTSYTSSLFEGGINKIAQKVGEEAVELVIEAKDNNRELFLNEAADLLFHFLVLLQQKGVRLENVVSVLKNRHQK